MKHINVSLFVPHSGCPHTCSFCNQKTISGHCKPLTAEEIVSACQIASEGVHDVKNSEIAFFGGSFTAIEREQMVAYLETAAPYVGTQFNGIRVSTRPDCITEEILALLKKYGVTAIELGAQSMSDRVLELNERGHTAEDTYKAAELIKRQGFSLGLQMMTGLYGASCQDDIDTARRFVELKPDTVRIYPTVVLENTRLCELYRRGEYVPRGFEETARLCAELLKMFTEQSIKVIRLGLHSGGNVEQGYVAGVYHPAFREICESLIFKDEAQRLLQPLPKGKYTLLVPKGATSKMIGQKKSNISCFAQMGYEITVSETDALTHYSIDIS